MAKLAGGGALRRWLYLFLIGSAAVCVAEEKEEPASVWVNNGTTMVLKEGTCVVAIKMEFDESNPTNATQLVEATLPSPHNREPSFRMQCFTESLDRTELETCQKAAEEACADGLFVYEMPQKKKNEMHDAMKDWSTPNVSFFINCLERDPKEYSTVTEEPGKDRREIECLGGKEVQFERSLVDLYPRVRVELLGDENRKKEEPWYYGPLPQDSEQEGTKEPKKNGLLYLARDLTQDGTTINWKSEFVLSETLQQTYGQSPSSSGTWVDSGLTVIGIVTSPGKCPQMELIKNNDSATELKEMGSKYKIKLSKKNEETEAELFFYEAYSKKGSLRLLPKEEVTVTPLLHQEMYPFLGAFEPGSAEFSGIVPRFHVKLRSKKWFNKLIEEEPTENSTASLTTFKCYCGDDTRCMVTKCIEKLSDPKSETPKNAVYISAEKTEALKRFIFEMIKRAKKIEDLKNMKRFFRFIIEGPWQSGMVRDSEAKVFGVQIGRPVTGILWWIKKKFLKIKRLFTRSPGFPEGKFHLNPELFLSYRDLHPSIVSYRDSKDKLKECYGKFVLLFNPIDWDVTAYWTDGAGNSKNSELFPKHEDQKIVLVHDLVGPVFLYPKRNSLRVPPVQFSRNPLHKLELSGLYADSPVYWSCKQDNVKTQGTNGSGKVVLTFLFQERDIINLRSTQIYERPSLLNQSDVGQDSK